jgi:XTP/dITP diphosphohydrolase
MRELLIATGNKGKVVEIRALLNGLPFTVVGLGDIGITKEVEEPAMTFEGNAIVKALSYGKLSGMLTLAEDSGLEIDALGGRPGVHTKRYAQGTNDEGHSKIFDEMKNVPDGKRGAQMRSVIAIFDPRAEKTRTCEGIARCVITREALDINGFGQDPICRYDDTGKTGGEMTMEEKNAVSHRGKALAKARELLLAEFA